MFKVVSAVVGKFCSPDTLPSGHLHQAATLERLRAQFVANAGLLLVGAALADPSQDPRLLVVELLAGPRASLPSVDVPESELCSRFGARVPSS